MTLSRRTLLTLSALAGLTAGCAAHSGSETETIRDSFLVDLDRHPDDVILLWPEGPPGPTDQPLTQHYVERSNPFGLPDRALHEITSPTLSVFRATSSNDVSLLLIPGSGYERVVVEKEGYEGARYFSRFGYDVYVMSYRLPHQGWAAGPDTPLQDAQRAIRLIREHVGPARKIMVMGFSAGGHVAGSLTQRFDDRVYEPSTPTDDLSARPDLSVLVYPVTLMGSPFTHAGSQERLIGPTPETGSLLKYDLTTTPNVHGPPVFLLHALDDTSVPVENSLLLALSYRQAGVEPVLHTFSEGGHGFGMRGISDTPLHIWPRLVMDWALSKL